MGFDPMTMALIMGGSAAISGGLGVMGNNSQVAAQNKLNKPYQQTQERKNRLIDELMASLDGHGRYSDLFKTDQHAFNTSFVQPAKSMFNNQIAPQIQQNAIANGTQRSSSMDDQLLRAGVDLDQLLNSHYMQFQNQGKDRMSSAINGILGAPNETPLQAPPTSTNSWANAGAGAVSGLANSYAMNTLMQSMFPGQSTNSTTQPPVAPMDKLNPASSAAANTANRPREGFRNNNF